jgi:PPM family protein phosphatase
MSSESGASAEERGLYVAWASDKDIGAREHDEDAVLARPDLSLFAVADGAGGQNAGNLASTIALASLARHFEATQRSIEEQSEFDGIGLHRRARRLSSAVHRANREVVEVARSSDRYRGMGTTVVALHPDLPRGLIHVAHVGDSRCYRLRAGRLEQLTQDHSLVEDVLELSPELDEATAGRLPENVITRALGMEPRVRVSVRTLDIATSDVYLLTSDGLTNVLSDTHIAEILTLARSAEDRARGLIHHARGLADDNVAVVVISIEAQRGVTTYPKRHRARPSPPSSAPPTALSRSTPPDEPEIVIVGDDDEDVLVVPPDDRAAKSLKDLARVVFPRPPALPTIPRRTRAPEES